MNSLLEIKRSNTGPKCANCSWWGGSVLATHAKCGLTNIVTLDLSVCSGWRDTPTQDVLKPED